MQEEEREAGAPMGNAEAHRPSRSHMDLPATAVALGEKEHVSSYDNHKRTVGLSDSHPRSAALYGAYSMGQPSPPAGTRSVCGDASGRGEWIKASLEEQRQYWRSSKSCRRVLFPTDHLVPLFRRTLSVSQSRSSERACRAQSTSQREG